MFNNRANPSFSPICWRPVASSQFTFSLAIRAFCISAGQVKLVIPPRAAYCPAKPRQRWKMAPSGLRISASLPLGSLAPGFQQSTPQTINLFPRVSFAFPASMPCRLHQLPNHQPSASPSPLPSGSLPPGFSGCQTHWEAGAPGPPRPQPACLRPAQGGGAAGHGQASGEGLPWRCPSAKALNPKGFRQTYWPAGWKCGRQHPGTQPEGLASPSLRVSIVLSP